MDKAYNQPQSVSKVADFFLSKTTRYSLENSSIFVFLW